MSLRARLFLLITLTVFLAVAAVTALVSITTTRTYEALNAGRSQSLADDFQQEFNRRAEAISSRAQLLARSDAALQLAAEMSSARDSSQFVDSSERLGAPDLDILEVLDSTGVIISSRQFPARFGYKESWFTPTAGHAAPVFLQAIDSPSGSALALIAVEPINAAASTFYLVAGERLDRNLTSSLQPPAGFAAMIDIGDSVLPLGNPPGSRDLVSVASDGASSDLQALLAAVRDQRRPATRTVSLPSLGNGAHAALHAYPLFDRDNQVLGSLVVASSNADLLRLDRRIRWSAAIVAGIGILLAILFSSLLAARITQPIQTLAAAADDVARGNLGGQVDDSSQDEIGRLAYAFNRMTRELLDQREKLVQSERVAAWRELARRLAHELKNPLFPLQITVENLLRGREQNPAQFEEVFRESTATLLAEIGNLKQIIARFSDFSKMPAPELQPVNLNQLVRDALRVYEPQLNSSGRPAITPVFELQEVLDREKLSADPALLHRALSNLILNALDAMPSGGTLTLRTRAQDGAVQIQVADTGVGLTPEERDRIFTPYYTSKQHGTGLGLAIVQSIVSDHGGRISVESRPQQGSTFIIELPRR